MSSVASGERDRTRAERISAADAAALVRGARDKTARVVDINSPAKRTPGGQPGGESAAHRHISGTGGQSQFVRGAYASKGGKAFICMSSTYERHGVRASRIVLDLTPGNVVTHHARGHDVRRHRVRDRQPQGQVRPRASPSDDLHRASRL